jgi:hypothetical protein
MFEYGFYEMLNLAEDCDEMYGFYTSYDLEAKEIQVVVDSKKLFTSSNFDEMGRPTKFFLECERNCESKEEAQTMVLYKFEDFTVTAFFK